MQILSKKRYQFENGDEKVVTAGNMVVETIPDWAKKDAYFQMCVADGDIFVIEGKGKAADAQIAAALGEKKEVPPKKEA